MATSSSSAKKVAKLAQRGKGKKVRFQGGTVFPVAVLVVVVLGLLAIVYARQSRPDPGSQPPQVGDHWHAAYGMYVCDGWLPKLQGTKEETSLDASTGGEADDEFASTGIHSHADGVIHYHPYTTKAVGSRAKLGLFLDIYDVELNKEELSFPTDQGGEKYVVDDMTCNGEDVSVRVVVWDNYTDEGKGTTYVTDFDNIRIKNDGMVFTIAIVPAGAEVTMPPWADDLPSLGAADSGNVPQTTVEATTDTATDDTATDDTATDDTATDDTATDDTTDATTAGTVTATT